MTYTKRAAVAAVASLLALLGLAPAAQAAAPRPYVHVSVARGYYPVHVAVSAPAGHQVVSKSVALHNSRGKLVGQKHPTPGIYKVSVGVRYRAVRWTSTSTYIPGSLRFNVSCTVAESTNYDYDGGTAGSLGYANCSDPGGVYGPVSGNLFFSDIDTYPGDSVVINTVYFDGFYATKRLVSYGPTLTYSYVVKVRVR